MRRWLLPILVLLAAATPQARGYVQVLEEHVSLNSQPATLSRVYAYGLDLISQRDAGGTVYYFIYDGLGSTRLLTTTNGAVANVFAYDAYGTLIASNGVPQTVYLFAGEQFDPQLGFYYLRARYLNTGTGRFWTRDSWEGNQSDPLSLHKYLYCRANPVNCTDPSGHEIEGLPSVLSISQTLAALPGLSIRGPTAKATLAGSTCGPDITIALKNTLADVERVFTNAPAAARRAAADNVYLNPTEMLGSGWDIFKLASLGFGGTPDFGGGSKLGTGVGTDTVQFSYSSLKVYRGGSVNYALWGKMFHLIHRDVYKSVRYSETAAVSGAWMAKVWNWVRGYGNPLDEYTKQAKAFVRYGYSGTDPSSTASSLTPDPKNVAAPGAMEWHWMGLH